MKFAVDLAVCQNIGQCSFTAPEMFTLDDDGKLSFRNEATDEYVSPELTDDDADSAQSAAALCPMQAIRVD
ncbi:ferredoxin [Nocardia miyunensis]|uniref:ferredoxin n=1 Tax=Nocardia miyunensis TaxID=282684 RepID=UPI000AA84608|nr:ferredoxin [Nocardia miyunensis]